MTMTATPTVDDLLDDGQILAYEELAPHGWIALERVGGDDLAIVNAARVSFDTRSYTMDERNRGLLNFLMRERHGTPYEQVEFWFRGRAPIFVLREWVRHRIAEINEQSGRYDELPDEFWLPDIDAVRRSVPGSKPGQYVYEPVEKALAIYTIEQLAAVGQHAFNVYHDLLERGVAKEVARTCLPVSTYSSFVWKANLRSLMNFLSLRNHAQAQREIREYAEIMERFIAPHIPVTWAAFEANGRVAP